MVSYGGVNGCFHHTVDNVGGIFQLTFNVLFQGASHQRIDNHETNGQHTQKGEGIAQQKPIMDGQFLKYIFHSAPERQSEAYAMFLCV